MDVITSGTDEYGCKAYRELFDIIMSDIGKAIMMDKVELVLKPEIPLFIFSVRLKNSPDSMKLKDVASIRTEDADVHISITDERYAPEILSQLWKRYGRDNVDQSTRFDIAISDADADVIGEIEVSSGEAVLKDIIGAVWRAMPEGIRARHNYTDGNVVTILATEEIITQDMKDEALAVHKRMVEGA